MITNERKEKLLILLGITEEQLWDAINSAITDDSFGYTMNTDVYKCPHCHKDIFHFHDTFERIGDYLRGGEQ